MKKDKPKNVYGDEYVMDTSGHIRATGTKSAFSKYDGRPSSRTLQQIEEGTQIVSVIGRVSVVHPALASIKGKPDLLARPPISLLHEYKDPRKPIKMRTQTCDLCGTAFGMSGYLIHRRKC